jgi:hypothetical protein
VVGGRGQAVEDSRAGEHKCAGAHGHHDVRFVFDSANPLKLCWQVSTQLRADHDDRRLWRGFEGVVGSRRRQPPMRPETPPKAQRNR